jgi:hypothetical protein
MKKNHFGINLKSIIIYLGIAIVIAILAMITKSPKKLVYDEPFFIKNLELLLRNGVSKNALIYYESQAPGPLFQIVYYIIFKVLGICYSIINLRLFNFFFFNLSIFFFVKIFDSPFNKSFWLIFFSTYSIPFLYPVFGLALTECCSMFFISMAIYSLLKQKNIVISLLIYTFSLSMALLGRQTFIAIVPVFFIYIVHSDFKIGKKLLFSIFTSFSLIPITYLIIMWGGLVPPEQALVSGKSLFSISIENGLLGIGYSAISFFILNPSILTNFLKLKIFLISAIISLVAELILKVKYIPLGSFFNKLNYFHTIIPFIFPTIMFMVSIIYIHTLIKLIYEMYKKYENMRVMFLLFNFFMTITSFKIIHQFSSRYVAQYSFLSLNQEQNKSREFLDNLKIILLLVGAVLGLNSLYSYYTV